MRHPLVKAVGFTGSLKGGRALADLAAARPEPIPVYAEMGSINPVFILPGALAERAGGIATGLLASATQEVGQLCTNPGLIVMIRSPEAQAFVQRLTNGLRATPAAPMLTPGMAKAFAALTAARSRQSGVKPLVAGAANEGCAAPHWFETDALGFLGNPALSEEIFGPSALVVWCRDHAQMLEVAARLEGSLAVAVHAGAAETAAQANLVEVLATRAGRVVFNGYTTGVEVSHAIVHGGPYPATSDGGRSTSVGTRALQRWGRLVCYQNSPSALLPPELQDANPRGILRLVDGRFTDAKL